MKQPYTDIESTVKRYVLGQMSETEADDFESYYFDNPEVTELIEATQNIHAGLKSSETINESHSNLNPVDQGSVFGKLAGVMNFSVPAYAVVALLAGSLLVPNFQANKSTGPSYSDISLVHFSTASQRGASERAQLDLRDVSGQAAVLIKLKSVDFQYHVARLSDSTTGEVVWTSEPFEVGALSEKLLLLPRLDGTELVSFKIFSFRDGEASKAVSFCHFSEVCGS